MGLTAVAAEAKEADEGANVGVHQPKRLERQPLQVHQRSHALTDPLADPGLGETAMEVLTPIQCCTATLYKTFLCQEAFCAQRFTVAAAYGMWGLQMMRQGQADLDDDVVDEEVGGGWEGSADDLGDAAGVVHNEAQLAEGGAAQHGAQKHVPGGPVEEQAADAPVQAGQRRPLALRQRQPVCTKPVSTPPKPLSISPWTRPHAPELPAPLVRHRDHMPSWATLGQHTAFAASPLCHGSVLATLRQCSVSEGELPPSAGGGGRAPVEGVGQEEVLPEHEEDGGEDAGDEGAGHALALAVPLAVEAVGGVVAADGHRHLRHHPCPHHNAQ